MADADFKRFTVLVIDDNDAVRYQLKEQLTRLGFGNVLEAPNGDTAKTMLNSNIDVILCDIHMEHGNGLELLKHVRSLGNTLRTVPFLFLTGDPEAKVVQAAAKLKADAYLLKPISLENLKNKLTPLLTGTQASKSKH